MAASYLKGKKYNHFLAWLHLGLCLLTSPSVEHHVRRGLQVLTKPVVGVQVHAGLCRDACSCCRFAGQRASVFDFSLGAKWTAGRLGCRREGITGEPGAQQQHRCQGWDLGDSAMQQCFNPASLLSFILPVVTLPTQQAFWWVLQEQLWSPSAASATNLLAKTFALGQKQGVNPQVLFSSAGAKPGLFPFHV